MIRVLLNLAVIFALVTGGVYFGYSQLEDRLLGEVCKPFRSKAAERHETTAQAAGAGPEAVPSPVAQDFQIIVRRNIFQPAGGGKPIEEAAAPPPAPLTSLNLALAGTITGLEPEASAIVTDNAKRKQLIVKAGGTIAGTGAVVKAIAWNRVTLEVNGRTEVLEMPKPGSRQGPLLGREADRIEPPQPEVVEEPAAEMEPLVRPPVLRPHRRINLPPAPEAEDEGGLAEEELPPPEAEQEVPIELPPIE